MECFSTQSVRQMIAALDFLEAPLGRRALDPGNAYYLGYSAQAAHHVGQVYAVAHLQCKVQCSVITFVGEVDIFDVGFGIGNRCCYLGQNAALIGYDQFNAHLKGSVDVLIPHNVQPFVHAATSLA